MLYGFCLAFAECGFNKQCMHEWMKSTTSNKDSTGEQQRMGHMTPTFPIRTISVTKKSQKSAFLNVSPLACLSSPSLTESFQIGFSFKFKTSVGGAKSLTSKATYTIYSKAIRYLLSFHLKWGMTTTAMTLLQLKQMGSHQQSSSGGILP